MRQPVERAHGSGRVSGACGAQLNSAEARDAYGVVGAVECVVLAMEAAIASRS